MNKQMLQISKIAAWSFVYALVIGFILLPDIIAQTKQPTPNSADTYWFASRLATQDGKRLFDPYRDNSIRNYFYRFDHDELAEVVPGEDRALDEVTAVRIARHCPNRAIVVERDDATTVPLD